MRRYRSAFSSGSVWANARYRLGGTALNSTSIDFDKITPSVNLPASFLADSISAFCAGESSRNRAIFSTSSGGIDKHSHHSIMLSIGSAALGRSSMFCVANQYQAPNFLHIFVTFTTYGDSKGLRVMMWPSSVTLRIGLPRNWSRSAMLLTVLISEI